MKFQEKRQAIQAIRNAHTAKIDDRDVPVELLFLAFLAFIGFLTVLGGLFYACVNLMA